ncbi:MAG: radical SAM-associated putative lipoprotein [Bacteroidales bacterium]|nr:radical SAM-associated putative lipoprotein [Bacteroidales bacterium]
MYDNRKNVTSMFTRLCLAFMALLGFSSCDSSGEPLMYGMPTSSFESKGKVTDEKGNPVEGAEIRLTDEYAHSGVSSFATARSGADGSYLMDGSFSDMAHSFKVVCIPLDDSLQPDSVLIDVEPIHDKKYEKKYSDVFLYCGHYSITADFKLKKKE